jgi:hypothetical protein
MSTNDVLIAIVSADCEAAIRGESDTKKMLCKAFAAAKNHWMATEPDPQLKGALNAVLKTIGDEHPDRERLEAEIKLIGQFNAWLLAAQNGLQVEAPDVPEDYEPIGIMSLWLEPQ